MRKIIAIVGPTAVGKTKVSIELAKKLNAIIINADSTQVYKELNIGTAKIKEEEKENVPHFLFDIKSINEDYTIYDYQSDVRNLLSTYKDKNIIFVGGTGLYLKAALYDYQLLDDDNSKEEYLEFSNEQLYQKAIEKDPSMDIHPNNRRRLIRFLNKKSIIKQESSLIYDVAFIGLTTNREVLYERINKRVDKMINEGLLEEVKNFYDLKIKTKALNAIGYKELYLYFDNLITYEECINLIKQKSRNYAKRQYTWFNNQMNVKWFNVDFENIDNTIEEIYSYLNS